MKTNLPARRVRQHLRDGATVLFRFCAVASVFVLSVGLTRASIYTINVDSGTTGSFIAGQSYNETRAVDVTVLTPYNLSVSSMTLSGINGSGSAEAVIYDANTQALIASATGNLTGGSITLAISATLVSGDEYRVGFYGLLGSGTEFQPSGWTLNNETPYTESSGSLRINSAWESATDSFPNNPNIFVPEISMQVAPVPEPGTPAMTGFGLILTLLFYKGGRKGRIPVQES